MRCLLNDFKKVNIKINIGNKKIKRIYQYDLLQLAIKKLMFYINKMTRFLAKKNQTIILLNLNKM